jgi:hypothetical protein
MLRTTHSLYNALKTAKLGPHSTDTIVARREIEHDEASDISRTDPYARQCGKWMEFQVALGGQATNT